MRGKLKELSIMDWLALVVVVPDLVQEQFLDGVELPGFVEDDGGDADVPAQGEARSGAQRRGQQEQPMKRHLKEENRLRTGLPSYQNCPPSFYVFMIVQQRRH